MTKLYLIRHAEAEGNLYRVMHGQTNSSITENGLLQIAALAKRFQDIPLDACYASDLIRTRTTAQAITLPKQLPLHPDPRFRETCMGCWESSNFGYLYYREPEKLSKFSGDPASWIVPGAESYETYTGRFIGGLRDLGQKYDGQSIAIVSHAMIMRGVLRALFPQELKTLDVNHCDNTAVTLLRYENGRFSIEFLNDNSHLDPSISTMAHQARFNPDGSKLNYSLWFQPAEQDPAAAASLLGSRFSVSPDRCGVLAMYYETPVGYLELLRPEAAGPAGQICRMFLLPAYSDDLYALQLLGHAVFYYRAAGRACLQVAPQDELEAYRLFFLKNGFSFQGRLSENGQPLLEKNIHLYRYLSTAYPEKSRG